MEPDIAHRDISELHRKFWWHIALSIGIIIVGVFAVMVPLAATVAVESLAGIAFAAGGIILVIHSFRWRTGERLFLSLLLGLIYFAFGILLLAYPLTGIITLTMALALFLFVAGIVKIVNAFRMRPSHIWGWALLSGIVSLLLSLVIWAGLPLTALWVIGLIVGIDLIFAGFSLLMITLAVRRAVADKETFCIGKVCYSM
jgi:uncharacterized membrane protein HdeD (DUF308 family)